MRSDMTEVAVDCVNTFLHKYDSLPEKTEEQFEKVTKKSEDFAIQGIWRDPAKQNVRRINWVVDTTEDVMRKINASDSAPGVSQEFFGQKLLMYGAHEEDYLEGAPGTIIATREGAICIGTRDGAVWISHLKEPKNGKIPFKLPAVSMIGEEKLRSSGIQESKFDLFNKQKTTFKQVWYEEHGEVGILHFDFHNGAMNTDQCKILLDAYVEVKSRPVKVLVLAGGKDFFSNGIHLNKIEATTDPAHESWNNIRAINGIVKEILFNENQITISAVEGNAGAGGVFLAIASDQVWASETSVFNPHYKTMGLFGSELSTYTTPLRIGADKTKLIRDQCLPYSSASALQMNLIDQVIPRESNFTEEVLKKAQVLVESDADAVAKKIHLSNRRKSKQAIIAAEAKELKRMYDNFNSSVYRKARKAFVYKLPVIETPIHLVTYPLNGANNGVKTKGNVLSGNLYAEEIKCELAGKIKSAQEQDPTFRPSLAIVQVGDRADSNIYVSKKLKMTKKMGVSGIHLKLPRETTQHELMTAINDLNNENHVHGIMLQLPLDCTTAIDTVKVLDSVLPEKDVDCLGSKNRGLMMSGNLEGMLTCTPEACLQLIKKSGVIIQGARAVVVGRSVVVGGTVAEMLKWNDATVILCHEHTMNLKQEVRSADIVVAAVGIPNYIQGSWIKDGAVVIDCGINKVGKKLVGDVDYESASKRAGYITPVPGGVGPMTVQMLMKNTVKTAIAQHFADDQFKKADLKI